MLLILLMGHIVHYRVWQQDLKLRTNCLGGFAHSISQVYCYLMVLAYIEGGVPQWFAYDDCCHFAKYVYNPVRFYVQNVNPMQRLLSKHTQMAVDAFHFPGHVDKYCREHMDPKRDPQIAAINTIVCEEVFSWLSRYSGMLRYMNKSHYLFFILCVVDTHNERTERRCQPPPPHPAQLVPLQDLEKPSPSDLYKEALAGEVAKKGLLGNIVQELERPLLQQRDADSRIP